MKTSVYNLIILDESGSMSGVRKSTVDACNETINTIRAAQRKFAGTQEHFVSIYAFQSDGDRPSRYLVKNVPVEEVHHISQEDYDPCGCTPLYDAVGSTLTDLRHKVAKMERTVGAVTIITDGEENSSEHYSLGQVAKLIDALKELGWSFNFIGANIDVAKAAAVLNIDNHMVFEQSEEGMDHMREEENCARMCYYSRVEACCGEMGSPKEFAKQMKEAAKGYFDKGKKK